MVPIIIKPDIDSGLDGVIIYQPPTLKSPTLESEKLKVIVVPPPALERPADAGGGGPDCYKRCIYNCPVNDKVCKDLCVEYCE
jgi:hypothetical protein